MSLHMRQSQFSILRKLIVIMTVEKDCGKYPSSKLKNLCFKDLVIWSCWNVEGSLKINQCHSGWMRTLTWMPHSEGIVLHQLYFIYSKYCTFISWDKKQIAPFNRCTCIFIKIFLSVKLWNQNLLHSSAHHIYIYIYQRWFLSMFSSTAVGEKYEWAVKCLINFRLF